MPRWEIVDPAERLETARAVEALGIGIERVEVDAHATTRSRVVFGFSEETAAETAAAIMGGDPEIAHVEPAPVRGAVEAADHGAGIVGGDGRDRVFLAGTERVRHVASQLVRDVFRTIGARRVADDDVHAIRRRRRTQGQRLHGWAAVVSVVLALSISLPASANPVAHGSNTELTPLEAAKDYRPVFEACEDAAHVKRLALRTMTMGVTPRKLLVDPATLVTSLDDAAPWTCAPTSDDAQADTRFDHALRTASSGMVVRSHGSFMRNEGLLHGTGGGSFVTGDLCPSTKPLDRGFLELLATSEPGAPIALSISGLWLLHHADDFAWIREQIRTGALHVTWVNHSFHHPFDPRRAMSDNFLLRPGLDLDAEVLDTERLLIAQGETPSVFFRFPGLVADGALLARVQGLHLIALGADAWLTLSPMPRPGAIVLVHPNGNEPGGLKLFARYLGQGKLPTPFRPLTDAP